MSQGKNLLAEFIQTSKLEVEEPLSKLRENSEGERVVGVDGNYVIQELLAYLRETEPLWSLTGPLPVMFFPFLSAFFKYEHYLKYRIRPVVVFDGLTVNLFEDTPPRLQPRPQHSFTQWEKIQPGAMIRENKEPLLHELRERVGSPVSLDEDTEAYLVRNLAYFFQCDPTNQMNAIGPWGEVCRAPYWAWNQLAAFVHMNNKYVFEVVGKLECLCYENVDRVITKLDFEKGTFRYVERAKLLQALQTQQYLETVDNLSLIYGIVLSSSDTHFEDLIVNSRHERLAFSQSFVHMLQNLSKPQPQFGQHDQTPIASRIITNFESITADLRQRNTLRRIVAMIRSGPVLNSQMECLSLSRLTGHPTPVDMQHILGNQLPPILYYFCYSLALSPSILQSISLQCIFDYPQITDVKEYRMTGEKIIPLRTQIVYQLIQQLQMERVMVFQLHWRRYSSNMMPPASIPILRPPQIKLDEWRLDGETWRYDTSRGPITFSTVLPLSAHAVQQADYASVNEALAAIFLKSLDLLGYFTHATHQNGETGTEVSGKSIYSIALEPCPENFVEYGVLLIELLRTRTLTDTPFTFASSKKDPKLPQKSAQSQDEGDGFQFVCRMLSMLPVALKQPWSGEIDASLLAFNCILRSFSRTLRSSTEAIAASLFLTPPTNKFSLLEYKDIYMQLPFYNPPGIFAGIIIQYIIRRNDFTPNNNVGMSPEEAWHQLNEHFSDCSQLESAIFDIFSFWLAACSMIAKLNEEEPPIIDDKVIRYIQEIETVMYERAVFLDPFHFTRTPEFIAFYTSRAAHN